MGLALSCDSDKVINKEFIILAIANLLISISLILTNVNISKKTGGGIDGIIMLTPILYFVSSLLTIYTSFNCENKCKLNILLQVTNMIAYTIILGFHISNIYGNSAIKKAADLTDEDDDAPEASGETKTSQIMLMIAYVLYIIFCIIRLIPSLERKGNKVLMWIILILCIIIFPLLISKNSVKKIKTKSSLEITTSVFNILLFISLNLNSYNLLTLFGGCPLL